MFRILGIIAAVALAVSVVGCKSKSQTQQTSANTNTQQQIPKEPAKENAVSSANTQVRLTTNYGDIVIELDAQKAPITTANFLKYVKEGYYDGTLFHRVIARFMIQGGGFTLQGQKKPTNPSIKNEASNGLKNKRGTVAMARTNDPDSATSQFFINLVDNGRLDYVAGKNAGYAVFGKVVEGMDTVDKIGAVKTGIVAGMKDVPVQPVVIESARVIEPTR